jgi:hypothetical protein
MWLRGQAAGGLPGGKLGRAGVGQGQPVKAKGSATREQTPRQDFGRPPAWDNQEDRRPDLALVAGFAFTVVALPSDGRAPT